MRWLAGALSLAALLGLLGAGLAPRRHAALLAPAGGQALSNGNAVQAVDVRGPALNPTICIEASSTPGGAIGSRRGPAKIGQTVSVSAPIGGNKTQFDVTITEVATGQEALNRLKEANQFNEPPPEGQEYVLFFSRAHITKTSGDQAVFLSNFDWHMVDSSGKIVTPASVVEPSPEFGGNGFEGATIEGWNSITRGIGEQVSLVFGLQTPQGTGGAWFTVPGK